MKKYTTLGELLIDYRGFENMSQLDLATLVNVDVRTIQRWEKNITLIKPEKEEELILQTLLPYQLIRNLNAIVPISTYYDFEIKKYSLTERTNEIPSASRFKEQFHIQSERVRTIDFDLDMGFLTRFMKSNKDNSHLIDPEIIKQAIKIAPEINVLITDDSGYYSGHCIMLPITIEAMNKLESREITKEQLKISDIVDYKEQDTAVFFGYDVAGDCNDTIYYLVSKVMKFYIGIQQLDYIYCSVQSRYDSFNFTRDAGLKIVWTDEHNKNLRFHKGDFKAFLASQL